MASKRLRHFPFSRWIKESKFITFFNGFKHNKLHSICIKEDVRIATMINVLEFFRLQQNVFISVQLNGQVSWAESICEEEKSSMTSPWSYN